MGGDKMRKIIWGSLAVLSTLALAGCGNDHHQQSQARSQTSSKKVAASQTTHHQVAALWNSDKDQQLAKFINQWAPTMKQAYTKYDGKHELKLATGVKYPSQLKATTVNGQHDSIGWSPKGTGKYAYNVVALYNDNQGGNQHITYAFAFHDGQPVALVDQSTNGTPNWTPTRNADVANGFSQIAAGKGANSGQANQASQTSTSDDSLNGVDANGKPTHVITLEEALGAIHRAGLDSDWPTPGQIPPHVGNVYHPLDDGSGYMFSLFIDDDTYENYLVYPNGKGHYHIIQKKGPHHNGDRGPLTEREFDV